jgi:multiple sugar transport system ATP-binding protein
MKDGAIQQYDHPTTVYDLPANQFVGSFIGNPPMNFLTGRVQASNGAVRVLVGEHPLLPYPALQPLLRDYAGKDVGIGIRAENMETFNQPCDDALAVRVLVVEPLGSQNLLTVKMGADTVKVATHPTFEAAPDTDIWVRFPSDKIRWVDRETGLCLYP